MEEQEIIEKVETLPNNFSENDSIYISQENIEHLILFSKEKNFRIVDYSLFSL